MPAFEHGWWSAAYLLDKPVPEMDLPAFKGVLVQAQGRESAWPPWVVVEQGEYHVTARDVGVEFTFSGGGLAMGRSEFWRAEPSGRFYLKRAYQEDNPTWFSHPPGTVLDLILPIWRIGECVLHAHRVARLLSVPDSPVSFQARWTGLEGRELVSVANDRRQVVQRRVSTTDVVRTDTAFGADSVEGALPDIVRSLTSDLYYCFDFFEPGRMVEEELDRMLGRRA